MRSELPEHRHARRDCGGRRKIWLPFHSACVTLPQAGRMAAYLESVGGYDCRKLARMDPTGVGARGRWRGFWHHLRDHRHTEPLARA